MAKVDDAIRRASESVRRINIHHQYRSKTSAETTLRMLAFQFSDECGCGSQDKRLADFEVLQTKIGFETKGQIDDDGDIYEYCISATFEEHFYQYKFECTSVFSTSQSSDTDMADFQEPRPGED